LGPGDTGGREKKDNKKRRLSTRETKSSNKDFCDFHADILKFAGACSSEM